VDFTDTVEKTEQLLAPHLLCQYLFDLASRFHSFYEDCRIIGHEKEASRVLLCLAVEEVLKKAFLLLGITPIQEMRRNK
jgi:arginyl-tRNA synthetase